MLPPPLLPCLPAEIATHTIDHVANPNVSQIVGARDWLNKVGGGQTPATAAAHEEAQRLQPRPSRLCTAQFGPAWNGLQTAGIPLEKIQGFRAPFLIYSPEQREILNKNGALAGGRWRGMHRAGCGALGLPATALPSWIVSILRLHAMLACLVPHLPTTRPSLPPPSCL